VNEGDQERLRKKARDIFVKGLLPEDNDKKRRNELIAAKNALSKRYDTEKNYQENYPNKSDNSKIKYLKDLYNSFRRVTDFLIFDYKDDTKLKKSLKFLEAHNEIGSDADTMGKSRGISILRSTIELISHDNDIQAYLNS
jgi:hypothetical protein